jgi:hypothetical protein
MEKQLVPLKTPLAAAGVEAANTTVAGGLALVVGNVLMAAIPALCPYATAIYAILTVGIALGSKYVRKQAENKNLLTPVVPAATALPTFTPEQIAAFVTWLETKAPPAPQRAIGDSAASTIGLGTN